MKKVAVLYILLVSTHELERDMVESFKDKTYDDLDALKKKEMIQDVRALTLEELLNEINDGFDIFSDSWVTQVYFIENEKRYNILNFDESVVKANVNKEGVERYLQGKDESLYLLEEIR